MERLEAAEADLQEAKRREGLRFSHDKKTRAVVREVPAK